mmetsp:Transcript_11723/g.29654  ORF Transcript_11723/g.29654 Transcript_11723/m.29654 type:complete len:203 (+) Transcript_11723:1117-1725(+)
MVLVVASGIVHTAVHHKPARVLVVVLADLLPREYLPIADLRNRLASNGSSSNSCLRRAALDRIVGHPAAGRSARLRGLLKLHRPCRAGVHLELEDAVVHHAHQVPRESLRLRVLPLVPAAAPDLLCGGHPPDGRRHLPEHPAPIAAVLRGPLNGTQRCKLPRLTLVKGDLHADDLAATTCVDISLHGICRLRRSCQLFVMCG